VRDPVNAVYDASQVGDLVDSEEEHVGSRSDQANETGSGAKKKTGHSGRHAKSNTQPSAEGNDVGVRCFRSTHAYSQRSRYIYKISDPVKGLR
jgi:hypothetical protein